MGMMRCGRIRSGASSRLESWRRAGSGAVSSGAVLIRINSLISLAMEQPSGPPYRIKLALRVLSAGVVSVAGLHGEALGLRRQVDFAVTGCTRGLVGSVAQAVLISQLFVDALVDVLQRVLIRALEKGAAGFLGNALENFLAVRPGGLGHPAPPASAAPHARTEHGTEAATSTPGTL